MAENRVSHGPPLPKCASSEYGCCKDNETKAMGPNFLGCPGIYIHLSNLLMKDILILRIC